MEYPSEAGQGSVGSPTIGGSQAKENRFKAGIAQLVEH